MSGRGRRALAALVASGLVLPLLGGCGEGPVELPLPDLDAADLAACRAFTDALPSTLAGEPRVAVQPEDALGAAYGDPAFVVRCGVPVPAEFDATASCEDVSGVGWFVPPAQLDDQTADVTLTTPGYRPVVQVTVPGEYRPDGPANALAELADAVRAHLTLDQPCEGVG
ncbi:DUF3515 domain-containing protein [Nocardioides sp.]|uniref:DUF3515 domain-containing protein n=1 Tax=Nocardioides sp. TaxID=35761 RepID=UPI003513306B